MVFSGLKQERRDFCIVVVIWRRFHRVCTQQPAGDCDVSGYYFSFIYVSIPPLRRVAK